jgi:hypothetical protein
MDLATALAWGPILFAFAVIVSFFVQRIRWRHNVRRGKKNPGYYPTFAVLANAFQRLQRLAEPQLEYVLEEKSNDEADEDDQGEPADPIKHLDRQLRRIRNGEKLDRLTTLLR